MCIILSKSGNFILSIVYNITIFPPGGRGGGEGRKYYKYLANGYLLQFQRYRSDEVLQNEYRANPS